MPKMKLSKVGIDKIPFTTKDRVIYWDTDTKGLGLAVGLKTKTFVFQMDVKDPNKPKGYSTIKKTLGRYGLEITLEQAKELVRGSIDKETGEAVLGERIKAKLADAPKAGEGVTLGELVTAYFRETKRRDGKDRRLDSAIKYQNLVERHYSSWLELTLKDVSDMEPAVVMERFQQLSQAGAPTAKNGAVMLSACLKYGMALYPATLRTNPLDILFNKHVNVMPKTGVRTDFLAYEPDRQRNDFKTFFQGIQKLNDVRRDLALLILFTGARSKEIAKLTWQDVDIENQEIHLLDTKNRQALHAPLNSQSIEIIKRRQDQNTDDSKYIFPAIDERVTGHSGIRAEVLRKVTGLSITVHGLRRTFITLGRKLKRYEDTDRLTNHADGSVAGRHYDQTDIEDLRDTCQLLGNEIERRLLAVPAKVIDISTGRQAA